MKLPRLPLALLSALIPLCSPGLAQWDPGNGEWGKDDPSHLRLMTFNVEDGICSSNAKTEAENSGFHNWHALTRLVAAFQPDVLILQEVGDNSGNGTGSGVDSVSTLSQVLELFMHGGADPYEGGTVTAYVQKYAPSYDLPYLFVSTNSDGFNRNVILSRHPFADLNGDGRDRLSDIPWVESHQYAPGGDGGIRGFQFAEIDLPDGVYQGDVVVGNAHLKAGGSQNDLDQRLEASKNVAYFVDHLYNGGDAGVPDPFDKIQDSPSATQILDASTPVLMGGDWNEDESGNGRRGPAEWLSRARNGDPADGTDRDRSDALFDDAREPFSGERRTRSSSKLDYLYHQDSIATEIRAFVFNSDKVPSPAEFPPELLGFPLPDVISSWASDHLPVVADFELPTCPQARWNNYGPGWAGTLGIPSLTPSADPELGSSIDLHVSNSRGSSCQAMLLTGRRRWRQATPWDGLLLLHPLGIDYVTVPVGGLDWNYTIPDDPALCGRKVFVQVLMGDPGASRGVSFTPGLKMILGL